MVARLQQQTGGSVVTSKTLLVFSVVVVLASGAIWAGGADTISADGGDIKITPILHGSVQVEFGGLAIYLDPWTRGDYSQAPVADLILVTDIHGDHLDTEAIGKLSQEKTTLIVPEAAAGQVEGETVMANGEKVEISGVGIEAVPMYNLKRGPEEGKVFHDRGRGNGYILISPTRCRRPKRRSVCAPLRRRSSIPTTTADRTSTSSPPLWRMNPKSRSGSGSGTRVREILGL
jgi:hypothetical protein